MLADVPQAKRPRLFDEGAEHSSAARKGADGRARGLVDAHGDKARQFRL